MYSENLDIIAALCTSRWWWIWIPIRINLLKGCGVCKNYTLLLVKRSIRNGTVRYRTYERKGSAKVIYKSSWAHKNSRQLLLTCSNKIVYRNLINEATKTTIHINRQLFQTEVQQKTSYWS